MKINLKKLSAIIKELQFDLTPEQERKLGGAAVLRFRTLSDRDPLEEATKTQEAFNVIYNNVLYFKALTYELRLLLQNANSANGINVIVNKLAAAEDTLKFTRNLLASAAQDPMTVEEFTKTVETTRQRQGAAPNNYTDPTVSWSFLSRESVEAVILQNKRSIKDLKEELTTLNYQTEVQLPEEAIEPLRQLGLIA